MAPEAEEVAAAIRRTTPRNNAMPYGSPTDWKERIEMKMNRFPIASASRSRHSRVRAIVALALTTALMGAADAQAQATAPTGVQKCGTVAAAHWSIRGSGSGTSYSVSSNGFPCSLALKLVPGLTRQSNHGFGTGLKSPSSLK
jgi:hypothetical protein